MQKQLTWWLLGAVLAVPSLRAMDSEGHSALRLTPAPKEVSLHEGGFRVGPHTRIVVQFGHQSEDRLAAETLAEEIQDQSGLQLDIVGARSGHKSDGAIILARLEDAHVRRFLAAKGLTADKLIGNDGYLLFSDKSHLIVAANSGQGLFYGVQTLRQLLRPDGGKLACPGVGIRDWPGLADRGIPEDMKSAPATEMVKNFLKPQA